MSHFENKEHYLNFRQAWSHAVNSPRAKGCVAYKAEGTYFFNKSEYTHQNKGWVQAEHHILFNILRGKQQDYGFVVDSDGFKRAKDNLDRYIVWAKGVKEGRAGNCVVQLIKEFLEPFDGTISFKMLSQVEV